MMMMLLGDAVIVWNSIKRASIFPKKKKKQLMQHFQSVADADDVIIAFTKAKRKKVEEKLIPKNICELCTHIN